MKWLLTIYQIKIISHAQGLNHTRYLEFTLQGYYCPNKGQTTVDTVSNVCPENFYCPSGTNEAEEHPCPSGAMCAKVKNGKLRHVLFTYYILRSTIATLVGF